jgi:hypothetical protein
MRRGRRVPPGRGGRARVCACPGQRLHRSRQRQRHDRQGRCRGVLYRRIGWHGQRGRGQPRLATQRHWDGTGRGVCSSRLPGGGEQNLRGHLSGRRSGFRSRFLHHRQLTALPTSGLLLAQSRPVVLLSGERAGGREPVEGRQRSGGRFPTRSRSISSARCRPHLKSRLLFAVESRSGPKTPDRVRVSSRLHPSGSG